MAIWRSVYVYPEDVAFQLAKAKPTANLRAEAEWDEFFGYTQQVAWRVSDYITTETRRAFVPYLVTEEIEYERATYVRHWRHYNQSRLSLPFDIIQPLGVTIGGAIVPTANIRMDNANRPPCDALVLKDVDRYITCGSCDNWDKAFDVNGWWGYTDNAAQIYSTIQTINAALTDSAVSINVTAGLIPSYKHNMYLRVDDELMLVTGADSPSGFITVERGVNGTTAAAHNNYTIQRVNVPREIQDVATRLTAWLYQRRTPAGQGFPSEAYEIPSALPPFVTQIINNYRRVRMFMWRRAEQT